MKNQDIGASGIVGFTVGRPLVVVGFSVGKPSGPPRAGYAMTTSLVSTSSSTI